MADEGSGNTGNTLLRYIERVEQLDEEKAEISAAITAVLKQAKAAGFDPKVMRAMIRERRMDAAERAEWQALLDTYRATLGMLDGTPLGDEARRRFAEAKGHPEPEPASEGGGADTVPSPAPVPDDAGDEADVGEASPLPPRAVPGADSVPAARAEGEAAAKAGTAVTANPYPAGDRRRAAWDEGWCAAMGSDGMEIPAAYRRKPKKNPGDATSDRPKDEDQAS